MSVNNYYNIFFILTMYDNLKIKIIQFIIQLLVSKLLNFTFKSSYKYIILTLQISRIIHFH